MIYIAGQTLGGLTSIDRCSFPRQPLQVRLPVGQDDSTRVIKDFELSLGGQDINTSVGCCGTKRRIGLIKASKQCWWICRRWPDNVWLAKSPYTLVVFNCSTARKQRPTYLTSKRVRARASFAVSSPNASPESRIENTINNHYHMQSSPLYVLCASMRPETYDSRGELSDIKFGRGSDETPDTFKRRFYGEWGMGLAQPSDQLYRAEQNNLGCLARAVKNTKRDDSMRFTLCSCSSYTLALPALFFTLFPSIQRREYRQRFFDRVDPLQWLPCRFVFIFLSFIQKMPPGERPTARALRPTTQA
ncbi:hypothetical protein KQX54_004527 [Cotesia glomerata]|uniref:Uncharacterized protein n=1 Tax=Cotesia glomerata TaxID=32391 RepID=A0AAV7HX13_COTGL|nr:hypothetical protein KQX54_004527 [Cotesia glomerata]